MSKNISNDEVLKLAKLAKLSLSAEELERFAAEIESLLDYFERLDQLDLEGVQPTLSVHGRSSAWREDQIQNQPASPADLLNLAPHSAEQYIQVKRMI